MPRAYHSPRRAADAAETRAGIVAAAAELFVRDGYAATPMRAIAAEAAVSVQTVHLHGPKHQLLVAAFETAFAGDEGSHSLTERPAVLDIMEEPDFSVALDRYVDFLARANTRSAGVMRAMMAAADADPAVRTVYVDLEARRHRDMMLAAAWFVGRGRVPEAHTGLAADLIGIATGPDAFLYSTRTRKWTVGRYAAWVTDRLLHLADECAVLAAHPPTGGPDPL